MKKVYIVALLSYNYEDHILDYEEDVFESSNKKEAMSFFNKKVKEYSKDSSELFDENTPEEIWYWKIQLEECEETNEYVECIDVWAEENIFRPDLPMRVCEHCLMGIESHEGTQPKMTIYVDEDDEKESRCDWCKETGFDTLYVLI